MTLLRNFATVGGFTAASRILGFGRDILIAAALGAGPIADAFFVAFKLPNLFRRLFAEGAFNSAFVPILSRARSEEGDEGADRFASSVLSWLLVFLLAFTAAAEIATPALVWALAPGFAEEDTLALTVFYTRICMPYLAAMSLVAFFSGILNTHNKFAMAAFAPVLLNIVLIAALATALWMEIDPHQAGLFLTIGVCVAGLVLLRQRPSTAKGITFVTLEDETGTANLVLHQSTWEKFYNVARRSSAWIAFGRLESKYSVIHVVVDRLYDFAEYLQADGSRLDFESRDFR